MELRPELDWIWGVELRSRFEWVAQSMQSVRGSQGGGMLVVMESCGICSDLCLTVTLGAAWRMESGELSVGGSLAGGHGNGVAGTWT